jgi:mRNA interferase RelE/StbE
MYEVIVEKSVVKQLQKIPQPYFRKIKTALTNLGNNPSPNGYLKLKGREGYRIRVGEQLIVLIFTISHRKDVYE